MHDWKQSRLVCAIEAVLTLQTQQEYGRCTL